jgi:hypothetical protein
LLGDGEKFAGEIRHDATIRTDAALLKGGDGDFSAVNEARLFQ